MSYLDKRREHAGNNQHIRPDVPPLAQFQIREIQHRSSSQAIFMSGLGQIRTSGRRKQWEKVALLDEIFGQPGEQVALGRSAMDYLLAAQLRKYIMRAHADDTLIEGQRYGVRDHAGLLGQTKLLPG